MPCISVYVPEHTKPATRAPEHAPEEKGTQVPHVPEVPKEYLELGAAVGLIALLGWYLSSRR